MFLQVLSQFTLVVPGSEAVEVPGATRVAPEHVAQDSVTQSNAGRNGLHNVPREGNVCAILRQHELEEDDGDESETRAH